MTRAHVEIAHQIRRLSQVLGDIGPNGPDTDDTTELRGLLYGVARGPKAPYLPGGGKLPFARRRDRPRAVMKFVDHRQFRLAQGGPPMMWGMAHERTTAQVGH